MTRLAWYALAGLLLAADVASAKTLESARITLDPPAGWKVDEKPDALSMIGPNEEIAFLLLTLDGSTDDRKKQSAAKADQILSTVAKDIKWAGDWRKVQTNGMPTSANKGMASQAGKESRIAVLMIDTPAKKLVVFIAVIDAAKEKEYMPVVKKFIDSIKPMQ